MSEVLLFLIFLLYSSYVIIASIVEEIAFCVKAQELGVSSVSHLYGPTNVSRIRHSGIHKKWLAYTFV